ncbi:FAD-dependent oxidoreductase [Imbroritus primus]|uniref:FAD-dependent oxidoreductase n=1 Tax=Imbroritus primus TaxID=3058603 RepID=A0ACD3SSH2_9BURK|nr:FAD-dependent oxidoreductase [Burkholderiaceae bacterium PBA]
MHYAVVVVGSGLAGYSVAREFRKRNKTESLAVLTADDGHFYSKPTLSEAYRLGAPVEELSSRTAEGMAAQIKGEVVTGTHVQSLDRASRTLHTSHGPITYDKLVLALGAEPVRLPLVDDALADHVVSVNDLDDYRRFRALAEGKRDIAILGAGLIGCEFANDLLHAGYRVKVLDIAPLPLSRLLPPANSQTLYDALQQAGVEWHLGTAVKSIEPRANGVTLRCADGAVLEADLVLSAVGLRPRTTLARAAGLEVAQGIVVDASLRTSDPAIYALGDCAEIAGLWMPYINPIGPAAKVIAAQLAGESATVSYGAMPVIVKTSVCPTVVCPPPAAEGSWQTSTDDAGVHSLFHDSAGSLRGFALNGACVARASELAQGMPKVLE